MADNNNNPATYILKSVRISMLQGPYAKKAPVEIGDLVFGFTYYEDITKPFISANLNINDSGKNYKHGFLEKKLLQMENGNAK